jgi:predicted PhzF superfamily epimerase YddE/YHI9
MDSMNKFHGWNLLRSDLFVTKWWDRKHTKASTMDIQRISAFSDGDTGGNPAGVLISDAHPSVEDMRAIAADVGFSETAFAAPQGNGAWRVRYFSPQSEVPFCGHATIALGSALTREFGPGRYNLKLNEAEISVEGAVSGELVEAALQSPPTRSQPAPDDVVSEVYGSFRLHERSDRSAHPASARPWWRRSFRA